MKLIKGGGGGGWQVGYLQNLGLPIPKSKQWRAGGFKSWTFEDKVRTKSYATPIHFQLPPSRARKENWEEQSQMKIFGRNTNSQLLDY